MSGADPAPAEALSPGVEEAMTVLRLLRSDDQLGALYRYRETYDHVDAGWRKEAEVQRKRADDALQQADAERARAEDALQRADAERREKEAERARADALAAELAALRAAAALQRE